MSHLAAALFIALASVYRPEWVSSINPDNVYIAAVSGVACSNDNPFLKMTACTNRKSCIPVARVCDGRVDCGDGSDETAAACRSVHTNICASVVTSGSQFPCKYGGSVKEALVCDGKPDCTDGSDEAECRRCHCKRSSNAYFQCDYGGCIEKKKRCDGVRDCSDGSDEESCNVTPAQTSSTTSTTTTTTRKPTTPSKRSCVLPPHPEHGMNYMTCRKGEDARNCQRQPGEVVVHGTHLITECHFKYVLASGNGYSVCDNGVWRPPQHVCTECGVSSKRFDEDEEDLLLIRHGDQADIEDFPWMAAVYHSTKSGSWQQVCGGTLITSHIVLTAAHCVVSKGGIRVKAEDIQVGLGKLYRDYYQSESTAVLLQVREVALPQKYVGNAHNYDLDIALLGLAQRVVLSSAIRPACLDLQGRLGLRQSFSGYMAGWGNTEEGGASEKLLWARQNYLQYETCLEKVGPENVRFVTHDKFCIIGARGSKADHGDSGGGLTFTLDEVHFVKGIVSAHIPSSRDQQVVLFTNLANGEHISWLKYYCRRLALYHK